jgi:hypothetical protein
MTTQSNIDSMNNFVLNFLDSSQLDDGIALWNEESNQNEMKSVLSKLRPKIQRACKKTKDPNKPKRSKSAYLFFCQAMREVVKAENSDLNAKEITSELGARWNEVKEDEEEIAEYVVQAAEDKVRYQEEMVDYVPPEPTDEPVNSRKKKTKKAGPTRSRSAYLYFCQEMRNEIKSENPDMSPKDVTSALGARWNEVKENADDIVEYVKKAEDDKKRYNAEKADWVDVENENENVVKKAPVKKVSAPVKKTAVKKVVAPVKKAPVKSVTSTTHVPAKKSKSLTPYNNYCQIERENVEAQNPKMKGPSVTKMLSESWKNLSSEEQQGYSV